MVVIRILFVIELLDRVDEVLVDLWFDREFKGKVKVTHDRD